MYVKVLAGALSVGDKSAPEAQEITWIRGAGLRLTRRMIKHLDLDTELTYLESGEATFMTAQGELKRRSQAVRTQFGGLLHFGDKYRPSIRLGAGLYGASVRREVGGSDERSFEFDLTFNGRLGLDMRVSENVRVGAALSIEGSLNEDRRTFEAGVFAGYGWAGDNRR